MKKQVLCLAAMAAVVFALVSSAGARPVNVYTQFDPRQDDWVLDGWRHELGNAPAFPPWQEIASWYVGPTSYRPCPTDYQYSANPNVVVAMQNLTPWTYDNVFYVADPETSLSNMDELLGEVGSTPWLAFKIDYVGLNRPLISESLIPDSIWQPGEVWEFVIQEYSNFPNNLSPAAFGSLGIAGASFGDLVSSGSIVVPEPGFAALITLGGLAFLRARRRCR